MRMDYRWAGVDIDAANESVERIKKRVARTFSPHVLAGIGTFGSLFDLKPLLEQYRHPVLVQSVDGVGTKILVARLMDRYDTIGADLVSACCNDIVVMGATPLTFLDYIANDKLDPAIVESLVAGMADACAEIGVSLVGGETAEMPDTYLPGEHDIVGMVTGVVEKDGIISGDAARPGDIVLGLPSSGLHTNGYSLARKLIFSVGRYSVSDTHPGLEKTIGETLLEPHINYTLPVRELLAGGAQIHGMAHITGGGFLDNIPRILPAGCAVEITKGTWPVLPIFSFLRDLGDLVEKELYRTFNMGIGLVLVAPVQEEERIRDIVKPFSECHAIGRVVAGIPSVRLL